MRLRPGARRAAAWLLSAVGVRAAPPRRRRGAGRLQAHYLNEQMGRQVAGGRLLIGFLQQGQAVVKDLGPI